MIKTKADAENIAKALRKMVIGTIICEYAMMELKDDISHELKCFVSNVLKDTKRVQDWFMFHNNSNSHYREVFRKEFLKDEILMISELVESVWGLKDADLEEIINSIKSNTDAVL